MGGSLDAVDSLHLIGRARVEELEFAVPGFEVYPQDVHAVRSGPRHGQEPATVGRDALRCEVVDDSRLVTAASEARVERRDHVENPGIPR